MVKIQDLVCYWDKVRITVKQIMSSFYLYTDHMKQSLDNPSPSSYHVTVIYFFLQMLKAPTLQNVSFTVKPEQLLAVIGPVGAGKVCSLILVLYRASVFNFHINVPDKWAKFQSNSPIVCLKAINRTFMHCITNPNCQHLTKWEYV